MERGKAPRNDCHFSLLAPRSLIEAVQAMAARNLQSANSYAPRDCGGFSLLALRSTFAAIPVCESAASYLDSYTGGRDRAST